MGTAINNGPSLFDWPARHAGVNSVAMADPLHPRPPMSADSARVKELLLAAAELPPEARPAFLAENCGADAELRNNVARLLADVAPASDAMTGTADITPGTPATLHPDSPSVGDPLRTTDIAHGSASTDGTNPRPDAPQLPAVPGYRVLKEIARGGMGRILAAFDLTLDRDVALKVLLPGAKSDRFVRESKITARLPHPGIPPVYALGTLADGSPFLAMKLIAGQTLAAEMKTADRPRLLQAFTQICQAVGFAHSRGVIHRDLKPANVMVGAFGEVQVMDWGLAKNLTGREVTATSPSSEVDGVSDIYPDPNETMDFHDSTEHLTQAGKIMGTPAYMAPEQARGEPTDARADVFALGGILCKVLTGHPPFGGKSSLEAIQKAGAGDLTEANSRLDKSGEDPDLIALCRRCLSPEPATRPTNGQVVADSMTAYLNGVQERLQAMERERAVATAKAFEQRRRRRVLAIAVGLVLFVLIAGITGTTIGLLDARQQRNLVDARNGELVTANANTETERNRAEQNFATARSLIFNMGNQINQIESGRKDPKLADLARKQALDDACRQFEQFRISQPDDLQIQLQAAVLHRFSANVSRTLNDSSAIAAYKSAIQILEQLTARKPDDVIVRDTLAQTLVDWALMEKRLGKLTDSAATLDRAFSIAKESKGGITEASFRRTLGVVELERSSIAYHRGRFEDADQFAKQARLHFQELLDLTKNNPSQIREHVDPLLLVMSLNLAAIIQRERGQKELALKTHEEALAQIKSLLKSDVSQDHLYWDCEVRRELGVTALAMPEHRAAAAADLIEVVKVLEKLVDDYPFVAFYREKLAASLTLRGELLLMLGQQTAALAEVVKSLAVSRVLIDRFGGLSASMLVRGQAFLAQGRIQAAAGKKEEAEASWKNAAKVFELAIKVDPENFEHRRGAAEAEQERKRIAKRPIQ
jgi:tetratricopeptide (TPR) repeat protein